MSKHSGVRTIRLPLRKIAAALPAVALISGGIVLSASAAPTSNPRLRPVALSAPAIVIPDTALTMPGSAQALIGPGPAHAPRTPLPGALASRSLVPLVPAGTAAGSSTLVTLDSTGIPVRALEGYRGAVTLIDSADPSCKLDWALLAAIGRVESNHARFGGNQLDSAGVARPGIIGMALDGSNGTALITDTDRGLLDRDTTYDRAVGPMQFIPSTWAFAGVDANGDGVKDPQNMADSAAATGRYLCSGPGDLTRPDDLRSAILRYNASDSYVSMVTSIANAYRHGVRALPAVDLAPVKASTVASRTASPAIRPATRRPARPAPKAPAKKPAVTPRTPAPTSSIPATTQVPQPTTTTSAPPTMSTGTSSSTTLPVCVPATTTSTAPPTGSSSPTATATCVPDPCLVAPTPGSSTSTTSTGSTTSTASPTSAVSPSTPTSVVCATGTAAATSAPAASSTTAP